MEERIIRLERLVAEQQKEIEALKSAVSIKKANDSAKANGSEKRKKEKPTQPLPLPLPLPLPAAPTIREQREEGSSSSHRDVVSTNKRNNALEKATRFIRTLPASISVESQCKLNLRNPLLATRAAAAAAAEPIIPITTKTVFKEGSLRIVPSVAFRGSAKKIRAIKIARLYDEYVAKARSKTLRVSPTVVPSLATWKQSASIAAPSSSSSSSSSSNNGVHSHKKTSISTASACKSQINSSIGAGTSTLTPSTRLTSLMMDTGGTSSSSGSGSGGILNNHGNNKRHLCSDSTEKGINMEVSSAILAVSERHSNGAQERRSSNGSSSSSNGGMLTTINGNVLDHSDNENIEMDLLPADDNNNNNDDDDHQLPKKRKRTLSIGNGNEERSGKRPSSTNTTISVGSTGGIDPIAEFLTELEHHSDDKMQRINTLQTLMDKFALKPVRTIKVMNGAKEHLYEWLSNEVDAIAEGTASVELLLIIMDVLDHALWKALDIVRIRIDKTLRKLYKTCAAMEDSTIATKFEPIMIRSKELWPKYRTLYKSIATDEGGTTVDD